MVKPDVIICWPRNADYPLWREFMRFNRDRFEKVIVVFTETYHGEDYREFVTNAMTPDAITFLQCPLITEGQDWRDVSVNLALTQSSSEWVWFTEQDFFTDDNFWLEVEKMLDDFSAFGVFVADRLHPCCIFAKRSFIERTRKNFGIVPDKLDHFALFQQDLNALTMVFPLNPSNYHHMTGLSHNMRLIAEGNQPVNDKADFDEYLEESLKTTVPRDARYEQISSQYLQVLAVKSE